MSLATLTKGTRTAHENDAHAAGFLRLLKIAETARTGAYRALLILVAGLLVSVGIWGSSGPLAELPLSETSPSATRGATWETPHTLVRLATSSEDRTAVRRSTPAEFELDLQVAEFEKEDEEGKFKDLAVRAPLDQPPISQTSAAGHIRRTFDAFVRPVGYSRQLPRGPPLRS